MDPSPKQEVQAGQERAPPGVILRNPVAWTADLPELEIREMQAGDSFDVKEFCLNNLMQRTRLSNQFVYKSPVWLSVYLSAIAWATHRIEPWMYGDWGQWAFLCCAISALFLVGIDYFTYKYYETDTKRAYDADPFLMSPGEFVKSGQGKCWLAVYNNSLAGTIVIRHASPQSSSVEISHWFVKARYRAKGLGGDLLREAVEHVRTLGCDSLTAKTNSINTQANKTLGRAGFQKSSSSPDSNAYRRILRMKDHQWTIKPKKFNLPEL